MSLFRIAGVIVACSAVGAGAAAAQASGTITATVTVTNTAVSASNIRVVRALGSNSSVRPTARQDNGSATVTTDRRPTNQADSRTAMPTVTIVYW